MQAHLPAVSRADVSQAITQLRGSGVNPSIRAIREHIGRGSLSTISKHVEAINTGKQTPEIHLEQFPNRLESLCREMVAVMDELARERLAAERAKLESRKEEVEKQWSALAHEKDKALHAYQHELKNTTDLQSRLSLALSELSKATADADDWKTRAVKAEAMNLQLEQRLSDTNHRLDTLRESFESLDRASKEQALRDSDAYRSAVLQLQQANEAVLINERNAFQRLSEAQQQSQRLESDQRIASKKLEASEATNAQQQKLISELSVALDATKKLATKSVEQMDHANAQRDALSAQLAQVQGALISAQDRIEQLRFNSVAESQSLIENLIDHSRRVFQHSQALSKKTDPDFRELEIAQREIERLFSHHQ